MSPWNSFLWLTGFFAKNGCRDNIEIEFVTPNTGIFTKPIATKVMTATAEEKEILVTPNFDLDTVNTEEKYIESARGDKIDYDLFISTMPNLGADYVENSGMGDGMGYVLQTIILSRPKSTKIYMLLGMQPMFQLQRQALLHIMKQILLLKTCSLKLMVKIPNLLLTVIQPVLSSQVMTKHSSLTLTTKQSHSLVNSPSRVSGLLSLWVKAVRITGAK